MTPATCAATYIKNQLIHSLQTLTFMIIPKPKNKNKKAKVNKKKKLFQKKDHNNGFKIRNMGEIFERELRSYLYIIPGHGQELL